MTTHRHTLDGHPQNTASNRRVPAKKNERKKRYLECVDIVSSPESTSTAAVSWPQVFAKSYHMIRSVNAPSTQFFSLVRFGVVPNSHSYSCTHVNKHTHTHEAHRRRSLDVHSGELRARPARILSACATAAAAANSLSRDGSRDFPAPRFIRLIWLRYAGRQSEKNANDV